MSAAADDADRVRAELRASWERAAPGWGRMADREGDWALPVSTRMIDHLALQSGQRVLELAAGAGDLGFRAAELVQPGGSLITSDGAEGMLDVARGRAQALGVTGVEFRQLELEWIDLPAASVDALLCRWGLMFALDPGAALREMRRVLRPGGRAAVAVWDRPEVNPWAVVPRQALVDLGHLEDVEPPGPSMFGLADRERLARLFEEAGFIEVAIDAVELIEDYPDVRSYIEQMADISTVFGRHWKPLSESERAAVIARAAELTEPFRDGEGLALPGRTLVVRAEA
jgi:ubiquinone/menaquinone biosynthesis C-methylase UbiE